MVFSGVIFAPDKKTGMSPVEEMVGEKINLKIQSSTFVVTKVLLTE